LVLVDNAASPKGRVWVLRNCVELVQYRYKIARSRKFLKTLSNNALSLLFGLGWDYLILRRSTAFRLSAGVDFDGTGGGDFHGANNQACPFNAQDRSLDVIQCEAERLLVLFLEASVCLYAGPWIEHAIANSLSKKSMASLLRQ